MIKSMLFVWKDSLRSVPTLEVLGLAMFLLHLIGEMEDSRLVVSLWRIQALPGAMYAIPFCGDHQLSSRRSCFTGEATSGVL